MTIICFRNFFLPPQPWPVLVGDGIHRDSVHWAASECFPCRVTNGKWKMRSLSWKSWIATQTSKQQGWAERAKGRGSLRCQPLAVLWASLQGKGLVGNSGFPPLSFQKTKSAFCPTIPFSHVICPLAPQQPNRWKQTLALAGLAAGHGLWTSSPAVSSWGPRRGLPPGHCVFFTVAGRRLNKEALLFKADCLLFIQMWLNYNLALPQGAPWSF